MYIRNRKSNDLIQLSLLSPPFPLHDLMFLTFWELLNLGGIDSVPGRGGGAFSRAGVVLWVMITPKVTSMSRGTEREQKG